MKTLWDVIWYNGGKGPSDGNNYWRRLTPAHYVWVGLALTLLSAGVGCLALTVGAVYPGITDVSFQWSYFSEPLILLLNILPVLLLTAFFYFSTGRAWAAYLASSVLVLAVAVVDFYKLIIRSDAFVASDLRLIGEAAGVLSGYTITLSGRAVLSLAAVAGGTAFAAVFLRGKLKKAWVRVPGALLSLGVLVTLLCTLYASDSFYDSVTNKTAKYNMWAEQQAYAAKGVLFSFLHSVPDAFPTPPEGYDEDDAAELLGSFAEGSIDADRRVNVVSVMLEAYSDLTRFEELDVREDVYAPLRKLQSESLHGDLLSNVYGGGTINTERCFLTGYTELGDYPRATESYLYFLRRNGYYTEGLHPGHSWFYNRENVERDLGMENFYFLEDYPDANRSDAFFFEKLRKLLDGRDRTRPYFNFSITYQNHGGYSDVSTVEENYLERGALSEGSFNIFNNYLSGIADTSARMLDFVDSLRDDPEPFIVVFFGDHMPYLGAALRDAGVDLDLSTAEGFANYYTTPYIIWANDAARAATGGSFTGRGPDLSACFLMDRLFDECGWGKSAYMQLSHALFERVEVVHTGVNAWYLDGELVHELSGEPRELYDGLRRVEYYLKNDYSGELLPGDRGRRPASAG